MSEIICDSYYVIGKSHLYCQDYAYHNNDLKFISVADGCSDSKDSDIGARILTLNAFKSIKLLKEQEKLIRFDTLKNHILLDIYNDRTFYSDKKYYLDSTLIVGYEDESNGIRITSFGDGFIIIKDHISKLIEINKINYKHNMPYYLSYELDSTRKKAYENFDEEDKFRMIVEKTNIDENGNIKDVDVNYYNHENNFGFYPGFIDSGDSPFHIIMITSDGLDSFKNIKTGEEIPVNEIVKNLLDFKSINKGVLKRRMIKMLSRYANRDIYPTDDFSAACFIVKE